jgi:hypothetical protein
MLLTMALLYIVLVVVLLAAGVGTATMLVIVAGPCARPAVCSTNSPRRTTWNCLIGV